MGESSPVDTKPVSNINHISEKLNKNKKSNQNKNVKVESNSRDLHIGTWNVRRGLVKRENEITNLLLSDDLDVLFLTETDIKSKT
jgi:hypothetical protein